MDDILSWLNPFNWFEGTLVELKRSGDPLHTITISTYGRVAVNFTRRGWLKPVLVYKLIDQYGVKDMEGDYSSQNEYWHIKLWTPRYGSWELQTNPLGPDGANRFINDILNMVKTIGTDNVTI
jgi:hypothetical protein